MTGDGGLSRCRRRPSARRCPRAHLDDLLALAARGIESLRALRTRRSPRRRAEPMPRVPPVQSLVLATRNAHKLREFEPAAGARRDRRRAAARRHRAAARGRRHVRRQRAAQGADGGARPRAAPRSPTTRGSRPRRWAGAPGVRSARYAGQHATDEENLDEAACARRRPGSRAALRLRARLRRSGKPARSGVFFGECRGRWPLSRGVTAGSATTRRSCPTTTPTAGRWPSSSDDEKDAISHRGRAVRALA